MAVELGAHDPVVLGEELRPPPVAELGRTLGRPDDVREEHGREDAVRLADAAVSR